ncbi:MAG TPA: ribonuclease E inhibitor RraB [Solirubrobacteraceae bacterium]|nr:ribonuclease E inhibitor RraB [Solirubrobacteraceae bacterium]
MSGGAGEGFRRLLARHLETNPRTWAALRSRGVDETTPLVIDFAFTAPGRRQADELVSVLRERTNFPCEARAEGPPLRRRWRVAGHTRPSTASAEMLDDWVTFMATVGAEHGCRFDGWGAAVPERPAGGE